MKKIYTKYDCICIYSKLGVITGIFAAVSMSLALLLGFIITFTNHGRPELSSQICLALFLLNLPIVFRNIKRYQAVQNKLQGKYPDDTEEETASQIILPNRKQLVGGIIILAVLTFAVLSLCFLMLWLMIAFYETVFLILFVFLGALSLPLLAVMVTYIRLLSIGKSLYQQTK